MNTSKRYSVQYYPLSTKEADGTFTPDTTTTYKALNIVADTATNAAIAFIYRGKERKPFVYGAVVDGKATSLSTIHESVEMATVRFFEAFGGQEKAFMAIRNRYKELKLI